MNHEPYSDNECRIKRIKLPPSPSPNPIIPDSATTLSLPPTPPIPPLLLSIPFPVSVARDEPTHRNMQSWVDTFTEWSHKERTAALETLISSRAVDVEHFRLLRQLIEPKLQRDFITLLPKELSLYVLSFLKPVHLLKAAQTCRCWRILCEDNLLWREKCREEGLLKNAETVAHLFKNRVNFRPDPMQLVANRLYAFSSANTSPGMESPPSSQSSSVSGGGGDGGGPSQVGVQPTPSPSPLPMPLHMNDFVPSEYKMGFLRYKWIDFNWRKGEFPPDRFITKAPSSSSGSAKHLLKSILQLKGHDDHVITCLQFNPMSNLIVSGSDDNTLKVWSAATGKCIRTLTGHTGGVWCSQLSPNDVVISGSTDRTLKVWNALTGANKHTLYGHTSTVRCMALHNSQVVSGSRDATLRVWNIETGECNHVLVGHVAAVRCVQFNGETVVSGAYDFLVKVWDVANETCLFTLEGHTNRVYSLQFDGENIVSGSLDTSIRVWSATSGTLKHTLIGHQSLTSGMQLRGTVLVSGNADSTVKVWDINSGQCLQTLAGPNKHNSAVTCLQFNDRFVITSSDDGTVKLWDLTTGEFIRNLVSLNSGGSGGVVWRIRASDTRLVCAVGSRNGTEETKLLVLDFDYETDKSFSELSTSEPFIELSDDEDDVVLLEQDQSSDIRGETDF